ncbi:hypothetical protein BCT49_07445 [Vibrio lentus]|uniref:Uncharacterized protein n=1 Tax=Vibrio lentus TaxID=136468 RepID=A0A2N7K4Y6_9VIBR|nr:hypothetical protein BCT49_07445 [Vibrio lentus]
MPLILEALVSFVISVNAVVALKDVEPKARPQAVVKLALSRAVDPLARCLIVLQCIDVNLWLRG